MVGQRRIVSLVRGDFRRRIAEKRTGGVGSILETLFHIVDTECSWIRGLKSERDLQEKFSDFTTLSKVRELDARLRPEVEGFVKNHPLYQTKLNLS